MPRAATIATASETNDSAGQRVHRRLDLVQSATVAFGTHILVGEVRNLSEDGGFVSVAECPTVAVDEGLRIGLGLPNGMYLSTCASVRWIRRTASEHGPPGFGFQFFGLGRSERSVIADFVAPHGRSDAQGVVSAKVTEKFLAEAKAGKLWIRINGLLDPPESQALQALVKHHLDAIHGPVVAIIDATRYTSMRESSLEALRKCLAELGTRQPLIGVLIGPDSVALLQLRRLTREAGVADSLASFDTEESAAPFLTQVEQQIGLGHRH